jgi:WD40 repeat protein
MRGTRDLDLRSPLACGHAVSSGKRSGSLRVRRLRESQAMKSGSGAAGACSASAPASSVPQKQTQSTKRTYADAHRPSSSVSVELPHGIVPKRRRRLSAATPGSREQSVLQRLFQRELDLSSAFASRTLTARDKFRNMQLQAIFDICPPESEMLRGTSVSASMWARPRSRVTEIASSSDLIFALTQSGVCAAFSRDSNAPICHLNSTDDEFIRSLFLNKTNDALITVSVFKADNFTSLHCRSTPLAHIRKGKLDSAVRIFESESLRWPGFVEFDDVNSKVLTFSAEDRNYKVWDLTTYKHLYTIHDERIFEVKISPGIMLLIHHRAESNSHIPLRIVDIESGITVKDFIHLLHRSRKIDLIELFDEKLLVKQEHENLQIVDVRTAEVLSVARSQFLTPSAFIFLYEKRMFLTFRQRQVCVWSFRGELVTTFEDHVLWHSDSHTNSIYITQHQDLIMSYCHGNSVGDGEADYGSINVSWISSGKSLAKVQCKSAADAVAKREALREVTSLFYNEERNEIYSGNAQGRLHVWSN